MNKVIYINNDGVFDINKDETLEIYHYVVDKSINIKINLNGENAKVMYHLSIISNNDNVCKIDVNHMSSNTESKIICHGVNTRDKKLEFYIVNKAEIMNYGIDKILWKVKNEGDLAKQKNDIRGQILETNSYTHTEYSKFDGDHYVEAYIIKNDVCIAKGKIDVPIRV